MLPLWSGPPPLGACPPRRTRRTPVPLHFSVRQGVLYYRKCAPNATDVDVRLPSGAAPTGCRVSLPPPSLGLHVFFG